MHLRFALFAGQPNGISLVDAQVNYGMLGAKDAAALKTVRLPMAGDERDPDWRAIDLDVDEPQSIPVDFDGLAQPEDTTTLYYWTPAYWNNSR